MIYDAVKIQISDVFPYPNSNVYYMSTIARSDEFHRALLFKAQQSINNNLNHIIVQNMAYRGRQGRVNSELTFDLSDIY